MNLDVMGRVERLGQRWRWLGWALAVHKRYSELYGNQMASAVTLTAFLTLFPLVLVGIAVIGFLSVGSDDLPERIVENLGLTGRAADTITDAVGTAERSRRLASVVGIVGLLWTGLGLAGAVAYAYNTVWQVQARGLKDRLVGLTWLAGMGVLLAATFAASSAIQWIGAGISVLVVAVGIALNTALFLWTSWVLPHRRVPLRALLSAALVGGVALEVLKVVGTILVPRLVANSSALYGTIGVVFALLAWLLVFGRLVVYVAVIEVVGWEKTHGTVSVEIELPRLPGVGIAGATRAGDRTRR
ncbi:MAG TPA: YihY/virulence factor BrkB family protein [Acidimicrobiia bacterium]|nr:YihY/virulence factor BrkB family protein [Acidimicrobiia bacterium]